MKNTFFLLSDEGSSSLPEEDMYRPSDLADKLQVACAYCWKKKGFDIHFLTSPFVLGSVVLSIFVRLDLLVGLLLKRK